MSNTPCTSFRYRKHWIAGSGEHGCLYDYGPNFHDYQSAVDDLASLFELGRTRKARLFADHYLELDPRKDGASYCEITECDCQDPSEHLDMGEDAPDWECADCGESLDDHLRTQGR